MTVERRLIEALRSTGDYEPSVDLYARLSRSITETRTHRRRVRWAMVGIVGGLLLLTVFLATMARFGPDGFEGFPSWSLQVVLLAVLVTLLITVGPTVRRLGAPLIEETFGMSPGTGKLFSRLLDVGYYLFFSGAILNSVDLDDLNATLDLTDLWAPVGAVAVFLTVLGVAHIANLMVLPIIGLVFSAVTRRTNLRNRGDSTEPVSPQVRSADRLASAIVMVGVFLMMLVVLAAVVAIALLDFGL